jgi:hypothetical protein
VGSPPVWESITVTVFMSTIVGIVRGSVLLEQPRGDDDFCTGSNRFWQSGKPRYFVPTVCNGFHAPLTTLYTVTPPYLRSPY